jgi:hypothetical protein
MIRTQVFCPLLGHNPNADATSYIRAQRVFPGPIRIAMNTTYLLIQLVVTQVHAFFGFLLAHFLTIRQPVCEFLLGALVLWVV